jgi:ribosomal protein L11 methyltransferase
LSSNESLHQLIVALVTSSRGGVLCRDLEKNIRHSCGFNRKPVRSAIAELVSSRVLQYSDRFGCSFLQLSVDKPRRISHRTVLKPQGIHYNGNPGDNVVSLAHGAAFGYGHHATTRMAIAAIEQVLFSSNDFIFEKNAMALDIGTGSGVLAIVSVLSGMHSALGLDNDVCALWEARNNVALNGLDDYIDISGRPVEELDLSCGLIMANLRLPTIKRLMGCLDRLLIPSGRLIVSGIRDYEDSRLCELCEKGGFVTVSRTLEDGWLCFVLKKQR